MKEIKFSLVVALLAIFFVGCSTVTIEGGGNENVVFSQPITVHGSMYGFAWDDSKDVVLAQNTKNRLLPIYSVKAHANYLYLLTGVLSFGLYYPQTFEYKLVVPEKVDDENETPYNPTAKIHSAKKRGGK